MSLTDIHYEAITSSMSSTKFSIDDRRRRGALDHPFMVLGIAGAAIALTIVAIFFRSNTTNPITAKRYEYSQEISHQRYQVP